MARPNAGPAVLSAQDLRNGRVVYWDGAGWADRLGEAAVARGVDAVAALATAADAANAGTRVIDAFVVDLADGPAGPRPARYREAQREAGPSIGYGPAPLPAAGGAA